MNNNSQARLLVEYSSRPGWFNMAADDYLSRTLPRDELKGVVRFYRWDPPAVSLGTHQPVDLIDCGACGRLGWDVVRRPTGGRALLHRADLCYALVMKLKGDAYRQLRSLYQAAAEAIAETLSRWGIRARVNGGVQRMETGPLRAARVCLTSRTRGEITVEGSKITAAAQRIYPHTVLQQGSILIEGDPGALAAVMNIPASEQTTLAERMRLQARTLKSLTGGEMDIDELIELLAVNFAKHLQFELTSDAWRPVEIERIGSTRNKFDLYRAARSPARVGIDV